MRTAAQRLGVYESLRWSPFYERIRSARRKKECRLELSHLGKIMKPGWLCFDIGANGGFKTDLLLWLGARQIIAVEPDPRNAQILKARYRNNPRVAVVEKAVGEKTGTAPFYSLGPGDPLNTLSEKWKKSLEDPSANRFGSASQFSETAVATTTLDALIQEYGVPDLIKLDIEGSELNALLGLSRAISLVWFEANLPEFSEETLGCLERLRKLGNAAEFNYSINTTEDPRFKYELEEWAPGDRIAEIVRSRRYRFMEIFARTTQAGSRTS